MKVGPINLVVTMQFSKILWVRGQFKKSFSTLLSNFDEFDNIDFEKEIRWTQYEKFAVIFFFFYLRIWGVTLFILLTHEENTV